MRAVKGLVVADLCVDAVDGVADILSGGHYHREGQQDHRGDTPGGGGGGIGDGGGGGDGGGEDGEDGGGM